MPTPFGTYIHINAVTVLPGHRLHVVFDNGTEQIVDLAPFLFGPLWGALWDEQLFAQVQVNPDTGTVEWPNGADLNPVILYDWPEVSMRIVAERQARYAATPVHRANTQALANVAGSWHDVDADAFGHAVREQPDQSYRPSMDG
jgi:hypothetical protein